MTKLLIGGYSGDKGAGSGLTVLEDDQVAATVPADSPSWIARHPELPVLYAVAETDDGRVHAWALRDGIPAAELGRGETGGAEPAHLTTDPSGRFLLTANYSGGSISVHRLGPDGSIGPRTDLVRHERHGDGPRQEQAHPHMIRAVDGRPAGHRSRRRRYLPLPADGGRPAQAGRSRHHAAGLRPAAHPARRRTVTTSPPS